MTRETLLDLIGQIDDDLIERAIHIQAQKPPYRKWASLSIAACLCIVIASVGFLPMRGCGAGSPADGAGASSGGSAQNSESSADTGMAADSGADQEDAPGDAVSVLSALTCLEPDTGLDMERSLSMDAGGADIQITDQYTVRSHAATDQSVTFAYPFDGTLDDSPVLMADDTAWSLTSEPMVYTLDGIGELMPDDWVALQLHFASDDAIAVSSGFQTIQADPSNTRTFLMRAGDWTDAGFLCVIAESGTVAAYEAFLCDAQGQPLSDQPTALHAAAQRAEALPGLDQSHAWTLTFRKTIPAQGSIAVELRRTAAASMQQWQVETDTDNLPSVSAALYVTLPDGARLEAPALSFLADAAGQTAQLKPGHMDAFALYS